MDNLIEKLKEIGFNTYEAKVYLALLKKHPATGYEVGQISGIPQARAYDTLKKLEKDMIVVADKSKPVKYTPVKPVEVTRRIKKKFSASIDYLDKNLPIVKDVVAETIKEEYGFEKFSENIKDILSSAKKEIYIELAADEYKILQPYLLAAYNRGVEVKILGVGNFQCTFGSFISHAKFDLEKSLDNSFLCVAVDNNEIFFGNVVKKELSKSSFIRARMKLVVFLVKEYILHDMYLAQVEQDMSEQLISTYGRNLKTLKDKIMGYK